MIIPLMIIVVFGICYVVKIRNNGLRKSIFQYPACFYELPIIGSLHHFVGDSEHAMKTILQAGENTVRLGGMSRIYGVNNYYLVFTSAQDVAEILRFYKDKDYIYSYFHAVVGNGSIFALDSSLSKVRRQAILPGLTPRILNSYVNMLVEESVRLTDALALFVHKEDFLAEIYLGEFSFNCMAKLADAEELREEICMKKLSYDYNRSLSLTVKRLFSYWKHPDLLYGLNSEYKELKNHVESFNKISSRILELRQNKLTINESMAKTKDETRTRRCNSIIDGLLESKLNYTAVCEEIAIVVGASDEAALTIGFTLMLLGQYPAVQDKVYEELIYIFGDSERPIEKDDLTKMHYLDMVIKESMRLFPTVPLIFRKANKEIKLSSGTVVPEGAGIALPIISMQRNPKHWGPNADHFDPDRFSPERLIHENAFMPFGHGPRKCPAHKLGELMIKICLCAVLRRFKIVDEPASSPVPNIKMKYEISLKPVNHFHIKLLNRV